MKTLRRAPDDRGETLIELLVAMAIIGTAVVAILGAVATAIMLTGTHRKMTTAGTDVRAFAEAIESSVAAPTTGYTPCTSGTLPSTIAATYAGLYTADTGYTASVVSVTFWDGSSFVGAAGSRGKCTSSTDTGVQKVLLKVSSSDGKVVDTLDVIIRRPCQTDGACS